MKRNYVFPRLMGKVTIFMICATMIFAMAGCGDKESKSSGDTVSKASSNESSVKADSTSVENKASGKISNLGDLAFKTKDGKSAKFNMGKADIEKAIGPGKHDLTDTYGQLSVVYRDDMPENMALTKENSSDESQYTVNGIKLGDKKSDVVKLMGTPPESMEGGTGSSIEYYFKVDNDNIQRLTSYKEIKGDGKYLAVIFAFNISSDEGKITDNSTVAMITEVSVTPELFQQ